MCACVPNNSQTRLSSYPYICLFYRMVRRGVLFSVCSVFLSMPSQNLLLELSDQLFEARSWLAGKKQTVVA